MQYSKAVTDYFSALPLKDQQTLTENLNWGITDGLTEIAARGKMEIPGVPPISDEIFFEIY